MQEKTKLSLDQVVDLMAFYQTKDYYSNSFFTSSGLEQIYDKIVAIHQDENYLYMIVDNYNHKRLYYFIRKDYSIKREEGQLLLNYQPLFLEHLYRHGEDISIISENLSSLGFKDYILRVRFRGSGRKLSLLEVSSKDYSPQVAREEDYEALYDLYLENFEPYTSNLEDKDKIKRNIDQGNIYIIKEADTIVGALEMYEDRKNLTIEHIVVSKDYRGKELGKKLLNVYIGKIKNEGYRPVFWVQADNESALGLYRQAGFIQDKLYSQSKNLIG